MNEKEAKPGKLLAVLTILVGGVLIIGGFSALTGYLLLPFGSGGADILSQELGQIAALFLGFVSGGLAVFHGINALRDVNSSWLRLPLFYIFWIIFGLVLGVGNLLLNLNIASTFAFPVIFLLGAALPTLAVLSWATRRLNFPISWRQGMLAIASGSTLSIIATLLLGSVLPYLMYLLIYPLESIAYSITDLLYFEGPGFLERLFFTPEVVVFLIFIALQAPIPEEFAKWLGLPLFGRLRIKNERQAFVIGLFSGAGFAILENMLYEGLYAQWSGWTWGGITLLRGFGSVLHPLCTGLVALGWYRSKEEGIMVFFKHYFWAVGLHTLWNGGFEPLVFLTGFDYYSDSFGDVVFYGEYINGVLIVFLVALSAWMWRILWRVSRELSVEQPAERVSAPISYRTLAAWAFVCVMILVPIGAALGPAWQEIQSVLLSAPVP
jgi:RsiW-degrading membrane proteinase PrsW (M82 family)